MMIIVRLNWDITRIELFFEQFWKNLSFREDSNNVYLNNLLFVPNWSSWLSKALDGRDQINAEIAGFTSAAKVNVVRYVLVILTFGLTLGALADLWALKLNRVSICPLHLCTYEELIEEIKLAFLRAIKKRDDRFVLICIGRKSMECRRRWSHCWAVAQETDDDKIFKDLFAKKVASKYHPIERWKGKDS